MGALFCPGNRNSNPISKKKQKKSKPTKGRFCVDFYKLNAVKDSNTSYVNMYFTHKPIPMPKSSLCLISTVGFGRSV